jgi:Glycosyl transferase family 2
MTQASAKMNALTDPEIRLLLPEDDAPAGEPIELSIVVPALNEEQTIALFVDWCKEGLQNAGVAGEILIVDSSTDRTAEIALAHGARVLKTPRRGLGRAYIDAIPFIRGKYVIMGDCDCTYDFRELKGFVEAFRRGMEYVMGTRFRGFIEDGAMPPLHRYFGTPVTTWMLNRIYRSRFTDIHCGMRGVTLEALQRMHLSSQGWEYASEMVLKSVHLKLATSEVPVRFYKDREGRLSHHRRTGWLSPWLAGWANLRAMFIYGPYFFLEKPGVLLLILGLLLSTPVVAGPVSLGPITLSLYWSFLGLSLNILGLQCIYMSILSRVILDLRGDVREKWLRRFRYDRSVLISVILSLGGVTLNIPFVMLYVGSGMLLPRTVGRENFLAVFGLFLIVAAFINFTFTLVLHAAAALRRGRG